VKIRQWQLCSRRIL